jgi:hypothetical protein
MLKNYATFKKFNDLVIPKNYRQIECAFGEKKGMIRTISLGSSTLVQGIFVKTLSDGRVTVRVDGSYFSGMPVKPAA